MNNYLHLSMALLLLAASGTAGATSWSETPSENLLVSGADAINQDYPLTCACPDGSTYVGWISWEDGTACLKLQLIGKDGDTKFAEGGMYICQYPTPTWTSGFEIASDTEGNAIIVYSDKRNDIWQAYAYKVSPTGEMPWGEGVSLADNLKDSCLNPKIAITDAGNIVIGYQALASGRNSLKLTKLTSEGKKAWGGTIEITGSNGLFGLVPSKSDSFLVTWFQSDKGNLAAMRYTANGEEAWSEPTLVDEGKAVIANEPVACPDGKGGIVIGWRHSLQGTLVDGRLQVVDYEGDTLWAESVSLYNVPQVCTDGEGNIIAAYTMGVDNNDNVFLNKYDSTGETVWATDWLLDPAYRIAIYGVKCVGDNAVAVYRNVSGLHAATINYVQIDADGDPVLLGEPVSTMSGDKGFGRLAYSGENQIVLAWTDNGSNNGGGKIYAQNIVPEVSAVETIEADTDFSPTYSEGVVTFRTAADFAGEFAVYDMTGSVMALCTVQADANGNARANVGTLTPGIYLLRYANHTAKIAIR